MRDTEEENKTNLDNSNSCLFSYNETEALDLRNAVSLQRELLETAVPTAALNQTVPGIPPGITDEPYPSAEASTSDQRACFPADVLVLLRGGVQVPMDRLKVGDEVYIGRGKYSPVLMFTHAKRNIQTQMVRLSGNGWKRRPLDSLLHCEDITTSK